MSKVPEEGLEELLQQLRAFRAQQETTQGANEKAVAAVQKYCQTQEEREGEESSRRGQKALEAQLKATTSTADCVRAQRVLEKSTKTLFLKAMLEFMRAQYTHYKFCFGLLKDMVPFMHALDTTLSKELAAAALQDEQDTAQLAQLERESNAQLAVETRLLPQDPEKQGFMARMGIKSPKNKRKSKKTSDSDSSGGAMTLVNADDSGRPSSALTEDVGDPFEIEAKPFTQGWLNRRHKKAWRLEFFAIEAGSLVSVDEQGRHTPVASLLLSTVRQCAYSSVERHRCFELITPTNKICLQSLTPREHALWMNALQAGIAGALETGNADGRDDKVLIDPIKVLSVVPGNTRCADCNADDTEWASINLGILLCIDCSGSHRSLGVHISKVRSVTLDRWTLATLEYMKLIGNERSNAYYAAHLADPPDGTLPTPATTKEDRIAFVRAKYIDLKYAAGERPDYEQAEVQAQAQAAASGPTDNPDSVTTHSAARAPRTAPAPLLLVGSEEIDDDDASEEGQPPAKSPLFVSQGLDVSDWRSRAQSVGSEATTPEVKQLPAGARAGRRASLPSTSVIRLSDGNSLLAFARPGLTDFGESSTDTPNVEYDQDEDDETLDDTDDDDPEEHEDGAEPPPKPSYNFRATPQSSQTQLNLHRMPASIRVSTMAPSHSPSADRWRRDAASKEHDDADGGRDELLHPKPRNDSSHDMLNALLADVEAEEQIKLAESRSVTPEPTAPEPTVPTSPNKELLVPEPLPDMARRSSLAQAQQNPIALPSAGSRVAGRPINANNVVNTQRLRRYTNDPEMIRPRVNSSSEEMARAVPGRNSMDSQVLLRADAPGVPVGLRRFSKGFNIRNVRETCLDGNEGNAFQRSQTEPPAPVGPANIPAAPANRGTADSADTCPPPQAQDADSTFQLTVSETF